VVRNEAAPSAPAAPPAAGDRILDRLPIGILVHRGERVLFANRFLLDLTGYENVEEIRADGGLVHMFRGSPALGGSGEDDSALALTTRGNENIAVTVRASSAEWEGEEADLLVIRRASRVDAPPPPQDSRIQELEAILDTATDGVIVLNETGRILSLNRSAEALFGYDEQAVAGDAITVLLAPESHMVALDYLESLRSSGVASLLNDGREVLGRERQGGSIPLFMTMGRLGDGPERRFCAVLRDITAFKKAEGELIGAKHAAEEASAQKSDLLAKISHEIRTPLNAILGFAEVMLEERFGPIGNDRYKEYLKDVHASGSHVISLVNDLLDLAKIEAGRLELSFTGVSLNDLVSGCVALLQPQAARDRIVMRMSFAPKLPPVVADDRSMRQIVLNLVSNAIKFTDAGGQVIVSTAVTDRGEVAFRVRDTGIGMTPEEVEAALEPFRQLATSRKRGGTGLGLPLTKALVEANRGALQISSRPREGTLVEVIFPPTQVLAE
jgi:PAS domain S-box-containing protein